MILNLTGYEVLDDLADAGGLGALFVDPYADDGTSDGTDRALRLKTRDGRDFPIEAILRSVPWRDGKALMLVVRRSGEVTAQWPCMRLATNGPASPTSKLKARIAEMRTIIDTATDGVVLIGRDGAIRSISRPAEVAVRLRQRRSDRQAVRFLVCDRKASAQRATISTDFPSPAWQAPWMMAVR